MPGGRAGVFVAKVVPRRAGGAGCGNLCRRSLRLRQGRAGLVVRALQETLRRRGKVRLRRAGLVVRAVAICVGGCYG